MRERSRRRTPKEQFELVIEARSSGLTDYQWCEKNGINYHTFHGWVNRLRNNHNCMIPKQSAMLNYISVPKQDVVKIEFENSRTDIDHPSVDLFSSVIDENPVQTRPVFSPVIEICCAGYDIKLSNHANPELVSFVLKSIGGGGLC